MTDSEASGLVYGSAIVLMGLMFAVHDCQNNSIQSAEDTLAEAKKNRTEAEEKDIHWELLRCKAKMTESVEVGGLNTFCAFKYPENVTKMTKAGYAMEKFGPGYCNTKFLDCYSVSWAAVTDSK
jgi:hypothetical protein